MNEIRVENGDTCYKLIDITSRQLDGLYLYVPSEGDQLMLTVRDARGQEVIVQRFTCDGRASPLISIQTNLPEAEYRYTIKLITAAGDVHTIVKDKKLVIE